MDQQAVTLHQIEQKDVKEFIQVLTPLANSQTCDHEVKKAAGEKLVEIISKARVFQESPIKKLM